MLPVMMTHHLSPFFSLVSLIFTQTHSYWVEILIASCLPILIDLPKDYCIIKIHTSVIHTLMQKYGLCDAFRYLKTSERIYSFFSHVHQTYSRIDYFFLDHKLLPYLHDCSYKGIVISDHAPVVLELQIPQQPPKYCQF